jgi:AcrR family transcriptional regulator
MGTTKIQQNQAAQRGPADGAPRDPEAGGAAAPPMRADARRNRQRLLDAARAAFAAHGADAPLDDIARQAGVGIGTLYRHFPTRLALQEAVYRDQVETLCALGDDLWEESAPGEALEAWMRGLVGYVATKRGLSQTLISSLGKDSEFLSSCSSLIRETGGRLLDSAKQSGAVRADAEITDVMRLCHAIVLAAEQAGEPAGSAERLVSLVLDGLRGNGRATTK